MKVMKTGVSTKLFLLIASIFVSSCTKDTLRDTNSVGTFLPATVQSGTIQDFGLVDGVHRLMKATLTNHPFLLSTSTGEVAGTAAELSINLYSAEHGFIPSGTYVYSDSQQILPFTFSSGYLRSENIYETGSNIDTQISDGTVNISQNGSDYTLEYNCNLSTGDVLSGSYNGKMGYENISVKK